MRLASLRFTTGSALLAVLALPLAAGSVPAGKPEEVGLSSERLHRIHEAIQRHIDAQDISGAVTVVARNGRMAHLEAHGLMDVDSKKPMAQSGLFWIASMTKPITGTAILMLMEEGKLRLNDPVSKFIPEFRGMKVAVIQDRPAGPAGAAASPLQFYTVPASREITIQDLLTHVSGLASGGAASTAELNKVARKPGETLAVYIPRLGATPLDFQPGSRWSYSPGAGFETLGRIVEIVSGQSFDQFLRQRIFEPLGMKDITFHPSDDKLPRVSTMYHRSPDGLAKVDTVRAPQQHRVFFGRGRIDGLTLKTICNSLKCWPMEAS